MSGSDTFGKSLVEAGLNPIKYTGRLITNPIGTVQSTLGGIGAMFGRIGSGLNNAGKTQDNALAGLLGVTSERRTIAAAYGVDPYTDFEPLDAKLKQLSEAAALGGLAVSGALLAVPGAAGIVVSNLSTANKLDNISIADLARQYTAAQILDINRAKLAAMGVSKELNGVILANRNYTPIDMAAMVAALDSMKDVAGRPVFIDRAAAADTRGSAYFMRQMAELIAKDYRPRGYTQIVAARSAVRRDPRRPHCHRGADRCGGMDAGDGDALQQLHDRAQGAGAEGRRRTAHHRRSDRARQEAAQGRRLERGREAEAVVRDSIFPPSAKSFGERVAGARHRPCCLRREVRRHSVSRPRQSRGMERREALHLKSHALRGVSAPGEGRASRGAPSRLFCPRGRASGRVRGLVPSPLAGQLSPPFAPASSSH